MSRSPDAATLERTTRTGSTAAGLRDLSVEHELAAAGVETIIGMDEVGRGCVAGPIGVGAVHYRLVDLLAGDIPAGIHDSKQLNITARQTIAQTVTAWQQHTAVAYASPAEIDALGVTLALCLAGRRALAALPPASLVLLDGSHDWLSSPLTLDCFDTFGPAAEVEVPDVRTIIKGDGTRVTIAAASVLAKVARDELMHALATEYPGYAWDSNVGYLTQAHRAGVAAHGMSPHHRRSFRIDV
ncbi:ribonuclease HII [Brevibacterium luteolum]|uniref:ribonuclease HII n=1 Tax=Brevibacterium luteolum TaxID=199591 RepID=UPI0021B00062|nr:ribonuclease HII [Brevibacterium luteolum]MCT1829821.1 ribonuclease HII [Brevibacterium luteolum]